MSDTQAAFTKVQRIAAFKENIDALGRQWCIFVVSGTSLKEVAPGKQETSNNNELVMVPDRALNLPSTTRMVKGHEVMVPHPLTTKFTSTWRAQEAIEKFVNGTWDEAEEALKKKQKKGAAKKEATEGSAEYGRQIIDGQVPGLTPP